jgi:hypothetical protein
MPLENAIPQIDDRTYDSLMEEVRTRISRYTPEPRCKPEAGLIGVKSCASK